MWMRNRLFQKMGGGMMESASIHMWSRIQFPTLAAKKDPRIVKLIRQVHKDRRSLMTAFEMYIVHSMASGCRSLDGDFAEVGVFKGASAKLISDAKQEKKLRLFDTFEGLPKSAPQDRGVHREHQYACSLEDVQEYLADCENLEYYKGIFPDSARDVPEAKYAFAHFDVDLYEGTLGCLNYFYPRMSQCGVMLSHDYSILAGVEQAFQEFFADKPEQVIDLPTTQCMVIKQ